MPISNSLTLRPRWVAYPAAGHGARYRTAGHRQRRNVRHVVGMPLLARKIQATVSGGEIPTPTLLSITLCCSVRTIPYLRTRDNLRRDRLCSERGHERSGLNVSVRALSLPMAALVPGSARFYRTIRRVARCEVSKPGAPRHAVGTAGAPPQLLMTC